MTLNVLSLVVLVTMTPWARAESDDNQTEAKAAYCETCHANDEANDLVTQDSRQKRRDEAAALTGDGTGKRPDEQGTGTGQ